MINQNLKTNFTNGVRERGSYSRRESKVERCVDFMVLKERKRKMKYDQNIASNVVKKRGLAFEDCKAKEVQNMLDRKERGNKTMAALIRKI